MRPRPAGGYEPDDRDRAELVELWHLSRTAVALPGEERQALFERHGGERGARIAWVVDRFVKAHAGEPGVAHKWVRVWSVENLGRQLDLAAAPADPDLFPPRRRRVLRGEAAASEAPRRSDPLVRTPSSRLEAEARVIAAAPPAPSEAAPVVASATPVNYGPPVSDIRRMGTLSDKDHRWVGRCKRCGVPHKVEGRVMGAVGVGSGRHESVVVSPDGSVYTGILNDPATLKVRCGDHWCTLHWVVEGTKKSKHECGSRCTNATGPNCDCRCRGLNHGSSL